MPSFRVNESIRGKQIRQYIFPVVLNCSASPRYIYIYLEHITGANIWPKCLLKLPLIPSANLNSTLNESIMALEVILDTPDYQIGRAHV